MPEGKYTTSLSLVITKKPIVEVRTFMSLNNEYAKLMGNGVANLVENHNYNAASNTIVYDASKVVFPEGVTSESLQTHVNFINDTSGQVRQATAEIARNQFENNPKLTTVDGKLDIGGVIINSQHHLRQTIGEEAYLYGHSTTQVTYHHTQEHADLLAEQDKTNIELATALFNK